MKHAIPIFTENYQCYKSFCHKDKNVWYKIRSVLTAIVLEYMNLSSISFMSYHYLTYSFIALTVLDLFQTSESQLLRNGAILCTRCFFFKKKHHYPTSRNVKLART